LVITLTKKKAEDLAEYYRELGVKVKYLHSDSDTLERSDILRGLRRGDFDVLIGINLLREGLDLPEVELVAILDADKEGFLRSKTSLVQTIGRAARHQEGRVILYADNITESMKYAIDETNRRRAYQKEYNEKFGITPTTIIKAIRDRLVDRQDEGTVNEVDYVKWIEESQPPKKDVKRLIKDLQDKMFIAAENLQFEKAAMYRDQLNELKEYAIDDK
jgi:excinuclease ABC subunit B